MNNHFDASSLITALTLELQPCLFDRMFYIFSAMKKVTEKRLHALCYKAYCKKESKALKIVLSALAFSGLQSMGIRKADLVSVITQLHSGKHETR